MAGQATVEDTAFWPQPTDLLWWQCCSTVWQPQRLSGPYPSIAAKHQAKSAHSGHALWHHGHWASHWQKQCSQHHKPKAQCGSKWPAWIHGDRGTALSGPGCSQSRYELTWAMSQILQLLWHSSAKSGPHAWACPRAAMGHLRINGKIEWFLHKTIGTMTAPNHVTISNVDMALLQHHFFR